MILKDTLTRLRAPLVTGYGGDKVRDWANATEVTFAAHVEPDQTREVLDNRDVTVTGLRAILPAATDFDATDRARWNGDVYEVDGDIERWRRRGRDHHVEVRLTRVEG